MNEEAIRARLDACLLEERPAAADSKVWAEAPNPVPELQMAEEEA